MKTDKVVITQNVIDAINGELAYQSALHSIGRADSEDHGIEGQLVTLAVYVRDAEVAWAKSSNNDASLDVLRKIAAIAIRALVVHGCPIRK